MAEAFVLEVSLQFIKSGEREDGKARNHEFVLKRSDVCVVLVSSWVGPTKMCPGGGKRYFNLGKWQT